MFGRNRGPVSPGMPYISPMTESSIPTRAPNETPADDAIVPFSVESLDLRGRIVRLGPSLDDILSGHDYPRPISKLLGEAIVLTVLLGSSLKFDGRFILQTQADGPVRMLVVDFVSPGRVRACARFDARDLEQAIALGRDSPGELLGTGHLAMTIDQGPGMNRYQGMVALTGGSLEDAAHEYFLRSEQIPTRVRHAVAEEYNAAGGPRPHWRAGGLMVQFLPATTERMRAPDLHPGDAPEGTGAHDLPEDEAWVEARSLVATAQDLELIDPGLSSERLLYRLFHEHGVRVFRPVDVESKCTCSREGVQTMLRSFPQDDRDHMVENGMISVTCEFCTSNYLFDPAEVADAAE